MLLYVNTNALSRAAAFVDNRTQTAPLAPPDFVLGDNLGIDLYLVDGEGNYDTRSGDGANSIRFGLGPIGGPLLAYQPAWVAIENGFRANVNFNTEEAHNFLAGVISRKTWLEIQIIEAGATARQTLVLTEVEFRRELIPNTPIIPTPIGDYMTAQEANKAFIQNRFSVTGLTGGGSNLDGLTTTDGAIESGSMAAVVVDGVLHFYQLLNSTAPENPPFTVRPDDYNASTNARVWTRTAEQLNIFTHVQTVPSATWNAPHTLGRNPVTAVIWINGEIVLAPVEASASSFTAWFGATYAGELRMI